MKMVPRTRKRRDQHHDDLLREPRHGVQAEHLVGKGVAVDDTDTDDSTNDVGICPPGFVEIQMRAIADGHKRRERDEQRRDAVAKRAHLDGQGGHPFRADQRDEQDVDHVKADQDQAGNDGTLVHVADGPAELVCQNDQHEAGRDDLCKGAGRHDDTGCDAPVIAIAQHDRQ
jgi:hypothetical protein